LQDDNQVSVAAVCRFISCILHNMELTHMSFNHEPSACFGHDAWMSEGLRVLSSEVVDDDWWSVLRMLRVRCVCARKLNLPRTQLTLLPRPAHSSTTA
jgi:hypothetical protein